MTKHPDSENLIPFRRHNNGYHLPQLDAETDKEMVDRVDPGLRPEDRRFIRHYLGYADVLLRAAEKEARQGKVIEMRLRNVKRQGKKAA